MDMLRHWKTYNDFSSIDFVWDEDFRDWVLRPTEELNLAWHNWLSVHPNRKPDLDAARQVVLSLRVQNIPFSNEDANKAIDRILQLAQTGPAPVDTYAEPLSEFEPIPPRGPILASFRWLRVAAILVALAGIGLVVFMGGGSKDRTETAYGNIKRIVLPDSSTIVLNANSSISFEKHWRKNKPREVWLDGEGFFTVKHLNRGNNIAQYDRFLVHVKDMTVEVLGTSFDIRSRRGRTEVVLKDGSIKLSFPNHERNDIIMQPSEMISIDPASADYIKRSTTQPEEYISWTQKKLMLNNATFQEVINYLEDNFGKTIVVDNPSLKNRKIEGTLLLDNLDDALFVLSKVLNVKVTRNDSAIYFKNN